MCRRGTRKWDTRHNRTGSVKTTRRVARLETVSVSSFLKSYAYDSSVHCTSKEPELMYVLHRLLPCADLRWTAPYLASYVFSCVFNKRSDPSCEGRIAGSLLSALHACTESELEKLTSVQHKCTIGSAVRANSRAGGRTRETHSSPSSSRSLEHAASLTLDGALAPQHHAEKIAPIRHG